MDKDTVEKAFISLVEQYRQIIYKVCYIYARDREHLNDLYQEIVLNLWKAYPRFRAECKTSTWIYRIALNTCITFIRRAGTRRRTGRPSHAAGRAIPDDQPPRPPPSGKRSGSNLSHPTAAPHIAAVAASPFRLSPEPFRSSH